MRWYNTTAATLAFAAGLLAAGYADAQQFNATLNGFDEVGGFGSNETGAILSTGTGSVKLTLDKKTSTIDYTLSFSGFPSGDTVSQARIQFGKPGVPGGILVFLCANSGSTPTAPAGTPLCTSSPLSGQLTGASVQAIPSQGVTTPDATTAFAALVAAINSGTAFANIQTSSYANGEIRGQLHATCQSQGGNGNGHGHGNGDGDGNGEGGPGDGDGNGEGGGGGNCSQNGG